MKRKVLFLTAVLCMLALGACKPKDNGGDQPGPGPDPGPESEITSNNAAPSGFVDDGPASWDE